MLIKEIHAKTILVKSNLPGADYVINPYTGCEFGCAYCYASFMGRFVNEPLENWGNYVYVKINAINVLQKELAKLKDKNKTIFISSVTDCYQGVEAKYKLTRGCLELLSNANYTGEVSILTKSSLVTCDIDVFKRIKNIDVGMTVTSTDDTVGRFLEVRASNETARFDALKKLNDNGIKTYAFIGPLLPHFRYKPELLEDLFQKIASTGVKEVFVENINMKQYILKRLLPVIKKESIDVQKVYKEAKNRENTEILNQMIYKLLDQYHLMLRTDKIIEHH